MFYSEILDRWAQQIYYTSSTSSMRQMHACTEILDFLQDTACVAMWRLSRVASWYLMNR